MLLGIRNENCGFEKREGRILALLKRYRVLISAHGSRPFLPAPGLVGVGRAALEDLDFFFGWYTSSTYFSEYQSSRGGNYRRQCSSARVRNFMDGMPISSRVFVLCIKELKSPRAREGKRFKWNELKKRDNVNDGCKWLPIARIQNIFCHLTRAW